MHFGLAAAGGSTLCLTVPVLPARTAFTTCTYACMNATACGPPQPPPATSGLCTATPPWLLCAWWTAPGQPASTPSPTGDPLGPARKATPPKSCLSPSRWREGDHC
jgi:hypothetical protein